MLRLPHRQFVFTLPKVLRVFFRHDTGLHGEIGRLIYGLLRDFVAEAVGRPRCAPPGSSCSRVRDPFAGSLPTGTACSSREASTMSIDSSTSPRSICKR
jgi:hypothetical protein